MQKDLRTFLNKIKTQYPEKYFEVEEKLDRDYEIGAVQELLAAKGKYPVVFYKNVEKSPMPMVSSLFASYELLGHALDVDGNEHEEILQTYIKRESNPLPMQEIAKADAPVKAQIFTGDKIDLDQVPISIHNELDSGRYISSGNLICIDPDSGVPNVGIYRMEVKNKNTLSWMVNPASHAAYIYRRHCELKKRMEVAIFIGHHPAVVLGSSSRGKLDEHNELETMGGLLNEPLQVVKAETVNINVPAYAEIVIEGYLDPGEMTQDGPFGEYAGYYGPEKEVAVLHVTAITMRKDPIYHDIRPSFREHTLAGVLGREAHMYKKVKEIIPTLKALHLPPSGASFYHLYMSIKKTVEGYGKFAALAALGVNYDLKHVFVFDEDINIYDNEQVLWAVATRVQGDIDISMIPYTFGAQLDPSSYAEDNRAGKGKLTTRVIIDATKPFHTEFPKVVKVPQEVSDKVSKMLNL